MTHCYLCGLPKEALEEEHVIPRILLKRHPARRYVKLCACRECNASKGLDDEYVVRYLQATSFTEAAKSGFRDALRGFGRTSGRGLHRDMIDRLGRVEVSSSAGIFLGDTNALWIQHNRFESFFRKIAQGIFVRISEAIYDWDQYDCTVRFEQNIQSQELLNDAYLDQLRRGARYGEYWKDTFAYFSDYDGRASCSFFHCFASYTAVVILIPKDVLVKPEYRI
jgi:hypothetical protein